MFSDILIGLISRDEQQAAKAVIRLAGSRDYELARSIERETAELITQFQGAQAGDFSLSAVLAELIEVLGNKGLKLPSDLFLLVKALITIEGVATALYPQFDFAEMVQSIPGDYYKLVDTLSAAHAGVSIDQGSTRPVRTSVLQASSALVSAIVLAALIVGSSIVIHSGVPPLWHDVPVIGVGGFIAAGVVGLGLLVKIIRIGGM